MKTIFDILVKLEPNEYAKKLRKALDDYDYPAVTYDFRLGVEVCHKSMSIVEKVIREKLLSQETEVVKDGLSSVLYWGFAYCPKLQEYNVSSFRDNVKDIQITQFKKLVNGDNDIGLCEIYNLHLPRFGQVSFTSKLLMFINPNRYPVLDSRIADFGHKNHFPPLRDVTFNRGSIPIIDEGNSPSSNVEIYEGWARWCRETTETINRNSSSSCEDLRPVDVERAIYVRIPENRRNGDVFHLLAGPKRG